MWEVRLDYRLIEVIGWVSSLSNKNPKLILNNRLVGMLFFWGGGRCTCSMWKFRGQGGIELCHSNDPSCCSDNAGSLTHYTTRELQACFFLSQRVRSTQRKGVQDVLVLPGRCGTFPGGVTRVFAVRQEHSCQI